MIVRSKSCNVTAGEIPRSIFGLFSRVMREFVFETAGIETERNSMKFYETEGKKTAEIAAA
jgi:hypothetical protein